jgi:hypothetical protein
MSNTGARRCTCVHRFYSNAIKLCIEKRTISFWLHCRLEAALHYSSLHGRVSFPLRLAAARTRILQILKHLLLHGFDAHRFVRLAEQTSKLSHRQTQTGQTGIALLDIVGI